MNLDFQNRCRQLGRILCVLLFVFVVGLGSGLAYEVAPGAAVRQLTSDGKSYTERGMGFAPKGDYVAFYKEITKSDRQLFLIKADGSDERAIGQVGWPTITGWSPDGNKIAFVSANKNNWKSDAQVIIYDLPSGQALKIPTKYRMGDFGMGENAPPVWSPDSKYFALHVWDEAAEAGYLTTFRAEDGQTTKLAPNLNGGTAWDIAATWSPDSKWIAFLGFSSHKDAVDWQPMEVWKCQPDGIELTQLTFERCQTGDPAWSPKGDWIIFHSTKGRTEEEKNIGWNWDIWMVRSDGSEMKQVTFGSRPGKTDRWSYVHTKWTPDGSRAFFHGWRQDEFGQGSIIFTCDSKGENLTPVMGPRDKDRRMDGYRKWASYDSTKILRHVSEYTLRGEGDNAQWTDIDDIVQIYDIPTGVMTDLVKSRRKTDTYYIYPYSESWSADSRSVLFTQGKVISWQQEQYKPDLYIVTLPEAPDAVSPDSAGQPDTAPALSGGAVASGDLHLVRPNYLEAKQAADLLPADLKSYVQVEPQRNLLLVSGTEEVARQIEDYIASIDTPAPQITLDVLVAEMSKTASRDLGLDWTYAKGRFGANIPTDSLGLGSIFYQGVGKLDREFFANLGLLEENGEVCINANPRLVALSGQEAKMSIRRTKYYFYTQGYDSFGRPIIQQSDISADITGKITPQALGDGNILVAVELGVGNFTFTSTSSLPDVTTRDAAANVMVKEGETLMISGLVLRQDTSSVSKTPLLGDLPVIGGLFRQNHRKTEESVLTIFITPHLGDVQAMKGMLTGN